MQIREDIKEGDVIVFKTKMSFIYERKQNHTTVVNSVEENHVDCGVDGRIHKSNIVKIKNNQDE